MRKVESLLAFLREIDDRKRALGITDEMIVDARNNGGRRTAEKRMALTRIQEHALKAGVKPLAAALSRHAISKS